MTNAPGKSTSAEARLTAGKLGAIASVFGQEVANRIAATLPQPVSDPVDPDTLEWQRNRLIRRLRDRMDENERRPAHGRVSGAAPKKAVRDLPDPIDRYPFPAKSALAAEHPAVIAHMLRGEDQAQRVHILRNLPGRIARDVMQRLREDR